MKRVIIIFSFIIFNMLCYSAGEISFIDISKDWRVELEGKSLKSDLPYYKTGYTGKMILRKKITLNEKASIYLYLSKIDDEDIVYFNGKEVGKTQLLNVYATKPF